MSTRTTTGLFRTLAVARAVFILGAWSWEVLRLPAQLQVQAGRQEASYQLSVSAPPRTERPARQPGGLADFASRRLTLRFFGGSAELRPARAGQIRDRR